MFSIFFVGRKTQCFICTC